MSTSLEFQPPPTSDSQTLQLLVEIGRFFNSSLEFPVVVGMVMDKVIEVTRAERGCLFLFDESGKPSMVGARGMERSVISTEDFSFSRSIVRRVYERHDPVLSCNAMGDERFTGIHTIAMHNIRSIMAVPILFQERIRGIVYVDNRLRNGVFSQASLDLLGAIAVQAAGAIENARLYNMKKEIILVLANAIEAKDEYTRGHVERVCGYCLAIGRALGLPPEDLRDLEIASFLHDVGKIGVPDAVLQKPGRLDDEERRRMERHSEMGEDLVRPIDVPLRIKRAIRQHQERWDGQGYPDRVAGEEITLFARIIAVADTWDAMTTDRPYRRALPREMAVDEMHRCAGVQLDPTIVRVFMQAVDAGEEIFPVGAAIGL